MPKIPYTKPSLNYNQQLQQLKSRGLTVEDDVKALHILNKIGYYRLSGYWYPMLMSPKSNHNFKPGSSFGNAFRIYCFDREMRLLVMSELEKIEVAIRAAMIYELSEIHGPFWYTDSSLFASQSKFTDTLSKIETEYYRTDEKYIQEFKKKYSDPLPPSWMMLELTSFGTLSKLYQNLRITRDKRVIAHRFGLDDTTFESWMHSLVYIRNSCAHHSRLWNKIMRITPKIPLNPANPWIAITTLPNPKDLTVVFPINNRTYYMFSMILYLLKSINPRNTFKSKLMALVKKYPNVDIKAMGFPAGWEQEELWK